VSHHPARPEPPILSDPSIDIRRLGPPDLATFQLLRLEALRTEPAAYASHVDDWQAMSDAQWLRRLEHPVFAAFQAGEPVGLIGLLPEQARKMAHRATVVMVYVRPPLRGSGLAARLMQTVADHGRASGLRQLELHVDAANPRAIQAYGKAGYREIGRIPGATRDGDRFGDDILMALRL